MESSLGKGVTIAKLAESRGMIFPRIGERYECEHNLLEQEVPQCGSADWKFPTMAAATCAHNNNNYNGIRVGSGLNLVFLTGAGCSSYDITTLVRKGGLEQG